MDDSVRPCGSGSVLLQIRSSGESSTWAADAGYAVLPPLEETEESEEVEYSLRKAVLELIESRPFFMLVTSAILSYTLLMAFEASYPDQKAIWRVMEGIYFAIFAIELSLRLYAFGWWDFFTNQDKGWNIFDFVVVATTAADMFHSWLMSSLGKNVSQSTVVSVFRAIRMFRILRSCRVIKHIKSLNLLLRGFVQSMQAAFWIATLLLTAVFIGAIICTSIIGHRAQEWGYGPNGDADDVAQIRLLFGTLVRSMITMFQLVTLDNWGPIIWLVGKQDPGMMVFFIAYSLITAFAMVALLTGIMTDQIQQASTQALNEEEELALQAYVDGLKEAFFSKKGPAALSEDDGLSYEELMHLLAQKEVNEVLLHDCDPDHLADVFRSLDLNGDGRVTWDEFRHGLFRIRGVASARQLYILKSDIVRTISMLQMHERPTGSDKSVLAERMERLEVRLRKLESRCKAAAAGALPPPRMVSMTISQPRMCSSPSEVLFCVSETLSGGCAPIT